MALSRGVPKREKPRNEASGLHWQSGIPPPSCPFFKICTTQFFQLPTFRARTRRYMCVCQGQDPGLKRTRRMEKGKFFFLDDSWNTFAKLSLAGHPKTNGSRIQNRFFKFMRGIIPLLPTESLSVIGGTGARCLFAQLVVQAILLSLPLSSSSSWTLLSTT